MDCKYCKNKNNEIEYKIIEGFSKYEISTCGKVRNVKTKRILKTSKREYGMVLLSNIDNKQYYLLVRRLVAKTYLENPNNYKMVNHKDGDKRNNNIDNLEWRSFS